MVLRACSRSFFEESESEKADILAIDSFSSAAEPETNEKQHIDILVRFTRHTHVE